MKPALLHSLAAMPARQLNLAAIGTVAIAAALVWTLAIRAPFAALRQQQLRVAALHASRGPVPVPSALPAAALVPPAAAPAPLALIAAVSASAREAGLVVSSAVPGPERSVAGLRQQNLDIEASGGYGAILGWLDGIEAGQPAVGITRVTLRAAPESANRIVQLQLGAYTAETK